MATENESVRAIDRAFDILAVFNNQQPTLTLHEISQKVGLANTTVFRILQTMERRGYVFKNLNGTYQLGLAILGLNQVVLKNLQLRDQAYPFMLSLRDAAQETVNLFVLRNKRRVCIESVDGPYQLNYRARIGDVLPLHLGASGKAILANQLDGFIREYLAELTENSPGKPIIDQQLFMTQMEQIRTQGYAYSNGEREIGLASISAPIRNHERQTIAAITVSGPEVRINGDKIKILADLAINAAREISRTIGGFS